MQSNDTADLIQRLTLEVRPVQAHALAQRLAAGAVLGGGVALLLLLLAVGVRDDLSSAMFTLPFWIKWLYVAALSVVGFACCARLARPDHAAGKLPWLLAAPVAVLVLFALYELQTAPSTTLSKLWLGHSALVCPWNITALALPIFAGVIWQMRRLAPTRLRAAGFVAGLLAGASGAVVYALYCNESAAPFILAWYTLGVLLPASIGALLGPRLLRW